MYTLSWELREGRCLGTNGSLLFKLTIPGNNIINSLSFSNLHNLLLLGDNQGYLHVWNINKGKRNHTLIHKFIVHTRGILGTDILNLRQTHLFLTGGENGIINLIDIISGKIIKKLEIGRWKGTIKGMAAIFTN